MYRADKAFYSDSDKTVRVCKTPDRSRKVAAWLLHFDAHRRIPDVGWTPPETPTPAPFEIRTLKGKGRGMVAARDINLGEVILRERPILMLPLRTPMLHPLEPWRDMEGPLLVLLYLLEQEDREKVVRLHNCKSLDSTLGPLGGILMTNAIAFRVPGSRICVDYAAICLTISYINHACAPNAWYEHSDTDTIVYSIRASRNIAKGEEITIGYLDDNGQSTAERQAQLREKYSFTCTCKLCSCGAASDERRKFIKATLPLVIPMAEKWRDLPLDRRALVSEGKRIFKTLEPLFKALEEEGRYDEDGLEGCIILCRMLAARLGDMKMYKKWTRRLMDTELVGKDTSRKRIEECERSLADPTSDPLWDSVAKDLAKYVTTIHIRC